MGVITLRKPAQRGRDWVLSGDIRLPAGSLLSVHAVITPEALEWAKRGAKGAGEWGRFGALANAAQGVLEGVARRPLLGQPSGDLQDAAEIVRLAMDGCPRALTFVQAHQSEPYIGASLLAGQIAQDNNICAHLRFLRDAHASGNIAAANVLDAVCLLSGAQKGGCACKAPSDGTLDVGYYAEDAVGGVAPSVDYVQSVHDTFLSAKAVPPGIKPHDYGRQLLRAIHGGGGGRGLERVLADPLTGRYRGANDRMWADDVRWNYPNIG